MMVWVIDCVADAAVPLPLTSPSPSVSTPRPITKMMTKMSLETTRATIVSIHLRTHEVEMSDVAPAKANGANTAATMMSSLRTIIAPQTKITAASTTSAKSRATAGLAMAVMAVAERIADPICCTESPVATATNPAERESTAASRRVVTAMAATLPTNATSKPLSARARPGGIPAQHRSDDLYDEQPGGHHHGQRGHDGQVLAEGRPGERDGGGPADLAPQPVHRRACRVGKVLGDLAEGRVGNGTGRAAGEGGQATCGIGERTTHQSSVQSATATAP